VNLLPRCKVNAEVSLEFKKLLKSWKRSHPHIESDIQSAFAEIEANILSCHGRLIVGGPRFDVYKYRQKSSDVARGSSYGLRVVALHDRDAGVMYPIIVYPKQAWSDVDNATLYVAIREVKLLLGHCIAPECDGKAPPSYPREVKVVADIQQIKVRCEKCRAVTWRELTPEEISN
jgi:hypothetical protein